MGTRPEWSSSTSMSFHFNDLSRSVYVQRAVGLGVFFCSILGEIKDGGIRNAERFFEFPHATTAPVLCFLEHPVRLGTSPRRQWRPEVDSLMPTVSSACRKRATIVVRKSCTKPTVLVLLYPRKRACGCAPTRTGAVRTLSYAVLR